MPSHAENIRRLTALANDGNRIAAHALARHHLDGTGGLEVDHAKGWAMLEHASDLGNARASKELCTPRGLKYKQARATGSRKALDAFVRECEAEDRTPRSPEGARDEEEDEKRWWRGASLKKRDPAPPSRASSVLASSRATTPGSSEADADALAGRLRRAGLTDYNAMASGGGGGPKSTIFKMNASAASAAPSTTSRGKNDARREKELTKRARAGDADAAWELSDVFLKNATFEGAAEGVDVASGWLWIDTAAGLGHRAAAAAMKTRIGQLYKDGPTALFLKVAPRGEKRFDWSVGECHERGEGGVKTPSMRDAQPHYRRGADAATPEEWHQLAKRCADGGHHADALRWYTKVARASTPGNVLPISVDAAYRVAMCHEKGTGVAANHETAVAWYRAAADGAHVEAASRLGILLFDKSKAYGEAVRWLEMAATRGDAVAGLKLGLAYATGKGVEKDPRAAAKARSISHWSPYDRVRV
eukprot:29801-Pelagococcus_subviridis.AAC.1